MEEYFPTEPVVPNDEPEKELAARWRKHFYDNNPKTTGVKMVDEFVQSGVEFVYLAIKNWENGYPLELPARVAAGPEREELEQREREAFDAKQDLPWPEYIRQNVRMPMVIYITLVHVLGLMGLLMMVTGNAKLQTVLFTVALWPISALGITAGAHRLWSHKSYKAGMPVRLLLMIFNSIANQGTIFHWSRDHRVHHKCSETPADPHNALRGFFFAHMGWLLVEKDPRVKHFGETINLDDLVDMWEVRFQKHMGFKWTLFWCFIWPALVAQSWGESFIVGFLLPGVFRYILGLHLTWLVNSAAHLYGERPYENINPAENPWVSLGAIGEGWHNWHHAFPFDYAASELGISEQFNPTKLFIDTFAHLGMVHSRKRATDHWKRRMDKLSRGEKINPKLIGIEAFKRRVVTYGPDREERIYGDQTPVKMADLAAEKKEKLAKNSVKTREEPRPRTVEEVEQHNTDDDCWIVIHNRVYDVTDFIADHPGGEEAVAVFAGKANRECTDAFDDTGHSDYAHDLLRDMFVGQLVASSQTKRSSKRLSSRSSSSKRLSTSSSKRKSLKSATSGLFKRKSSRKSSTSNKSKHASSSSVSTVGDTILNGSRRVGFQLESKETVTHDTVMLHFTPTAEAHSGVPLGLPVGNHIRVGATIQGALIERSYTPIPSEMSSMEPDRISLCVKVYRADENPNFPDGGMMSQHLDELPFGSRIAVRGPQGSITYHGKGTFETRRRGQFSVKQAGFICGGSGITPAYAIIYNGLMDAKDKTKFFLIYANKTPSDVLLRDEIDELARNFPKRFQVHYTVTDSSEDPDWEFSTGFVDEAMVKKYLPSGAKGDSFVGVCGPPPMIKFACEPNLEKHGYVKGESYNAF